MIRRVRVQRAGADNLDKKGIRDLVQDCYNQAGNIISIIVRQFKQEEDLKEGLFITGIDVSLIETEKLRRLMRMAHKNASDKDREWLQELAKEANDADNVNQPIYRIYDQLVEREVSKSYGSLFYEFYAKHQRQPNEREKEWFKYIRDKAHLMQFVDPPNWFMMASYTSPVPVPEDQIKVYQEWLSYQPK